MIASSAHLARSRRHSCFLLRAIFLRADTSRFPLRRQYLNVMRAVAAGGCIKAGRHVICYHDLASMLLEIYYKSRDKILVNGWPVVILFATRDRPSRDSSAIASPLQPF
jgi:hypothetical protein